MGGPTKNNNDISSNPAAFQESYARARTFFSKFDGVVGVAFGQKQTVGVYSNDIAIVVFVNEKKKNEQLSPDQQIPTSFEGYPTDVRVVQNSHLHGCDNTTTYDTIQGGIQISPPANPDTGGFDLGTLGCIVRQRGNSSRDNVYLLTDKHVLFEPWNGAGSYVYHPFAPPPNKNFGSNGDSNVLGPIQTQAFYGNLTIPGDSSGTTYFIDCGTARIDIDSKCCSTTCTKDTVHYAPSIIDLQLPTGSPVNTIKDVRDVRSDSSIIGQQVFKVGRTTGRTTGIVRLINTSVNVPGDPSVAGSTGFPALNVLEVDFDTTSVAGGKNCKGHAYFAELGDSGSLVLDDQGRAIGLISAGPSAEHGSPDPAPDHPCHIVPILDNLKICIVTTSGTSHGSCGATDGSGTAPAPATASSAAPAAAPPVPFAVKNLAATEVQSLPEPPIPNDAELRRLQEVLVAFRSTEKGRQLHDIFGQVRREIGYLVRNCRPVKIAWHRSQGPQYLSHVQRHFRGATDSVPHELNGVSRDRLLVRMDGALRKHGSIPLRAALEKYGTDLIRLLSRGESVDDWIRYMRNDEVTLAGSSAVTPR
jgi:hypothetical protein